MPESAGFEQLRAEYTTLAATAKVKTDDDVRSLRYFEVDRALEEGRIPAESSPRVHDWVDKVRRLEAFISTEGRMPVENRRKDHSEVSDEERTLSRWKADQLRAGRRTRPSIYQIRRLEGLEGFSWAPLDDRWDRQLVLFAAFVDARTAPQYRAGGTQRQVARWAQRQRDLYRRGALTQTRIDRLEATGFWTW
jgi:hypothetical protein